MGVDLSATMNPQFNADNDHASKQYDALAVVEMRAEDHDLTASELHQALVEKAEQARKSSSLAG